IHVFNEGFSMNFDNGFSGETGGVVSGGDDRDGAIGIHAPHIKNEVRFTIPRYGFSLPARIVRQVLKKIFPESSRAGVNPKYLYCRTVPVPQHWQQVC